MTRTTLLELTDDDLAAMLRSEPCVRPGLSAPPGGVDDPQVLAHVRRLAANLRREGYAGGHWMIVAGGEVVGLCGFKTPPSPDGEVEIGYGIAASRRRRGHARAALEALVEAARRDLTLRSIVAATLPENVPSQRVLERNGFELAGTLSEGGENLLLWRKRL